LNVKQFKRRWLNSKIEPEMFYMPVKKREIKTPEFLINFYFFQQVYDTNTQQKSIDPTLRDSAYVTIIIINTETNAKYRNNGNSSRISVLLPVGKYKFKYISVKQCGSRVNDKWYFFKINNNGEIVFSEPTFDVVLKNNRDLYIYVDISIWKFHIYYDNDVKVPFCKDQAESGEGRQYYPDNKGNLPSLLPMNETVSYSFKGCMVYDAWLDDQKIVAHKLYAPTYYHTVGLGALAMRKIGGSIGVGSTNELHGNCEFFFANSVWSKVPANIVDIDATINGLCLPYNISDRYQYASQCYYSGHTKAHMEGVTNSSEDMVESSNGSYIFACTATINNRTPIDVDETSDNSSFSSYRILTILENDFKSEFNISQFDQSTQYSYPFPKAYQVSNLAKPGRYAYSNYDAAFYSPKAWEKLRKREVALTNWITGFSNIARDIATFLSFSVYKYNYTDGIDRYYQYTHRVVIGKHWVPQKQTLNNSNYDNPPSLIYEMGGKITLDVLYPNGNYSSIEEAANIQFGTYFFEKITIEEDTYSGSASEIVFGSGVDFKNSTVYSSIVIDSNESVRPSRIVGNQSICNETENDAIIFVGAHFPETKTPDYDDWINDPDVQII